MPYFLQYNLVLAILVFLYWIIFRQKSFFRFNRWLLLSFFPLAGIIPQIKVSIQPSSATSLITSTFNQLKSDEIQSISNGSGGITSLETDNGTIFPLSTILWCLYAAGTIYFFFRFLRQAYQLRRFILMENKEHHKAYQLILSDTAPGSFSFFRYLIMPRSIAGTPLAIPIIAHEQVHIRERHSLDILLANLCTIICWFNPPAWKLRQLIERNHEYIVDETVLRGGMDARNYQLSLLQSQMNDFSNQITHAYNFSFLKKRIQMMQSTTNPRWMKIRYAIFGVSLVPLLLLFSTPQVPVSNQTLPGVEDGGILVLFTRQTTDTELEKTAEAFKKKGYFFRIQEINRTSEGLLDDFSIQVGQEGKSSGTSSLSNLEEKKVAQDEILEYLWYSSDSGSSAVGPPNSGMIQQVLQHKEKIECHLLGFSSPLDKLPQKIKKAEKARKARWKAEVKANDYIMTGSGSLSNRGFPLRTPAHKDRLKEKILNQQEERGCTAKIMYQNEQINFQDIDQIDEQSVRTTINFTEKYYYDKRFQLKKTECSELEIIITPL